MNAARELDSEHDDRESGGMPDDTFFGDDDASFEPAAPASDDSKPRAHFVLTTKGVIWFSGRMREDGSVESKWICSPLHVDAKVRENDGNGWGWLVRWKDGDGAEHRTVLDAASVAGEASAFVRPLLDGGLEIAPSAAKDVVRYVQTSQVQARARRVSAPGWTEDGAVYVASDGETFGQSSEAFIYTPGDSPSSPSGTNGTVESWRTSVARLCIGNSRYVFGVSAAFAAALLRDARVDGGGFHFVGLSSTGKTRLLWAAQSVIGPRRGVASWESTRNALGAQGLARNDAPLIVDEVGQASTKDFGNAVYLLCNGQEKARATKDGGLRTPRTWRTLILSTGEKDVEQVVAEGGQIAKAGQDARLASIPSDAGQGLGTFDVLPEGIADGAAMAHAVDVATRENFGAVGRAWLAHLADLGEGGRQRSARDGMTAFRETAIGELGAVAGEVHRVLDRFALVATAGELATTAGLTGWDEGEATRAALACFKAWLAKRGGAGSTDKQRMLRAARLLFEHRRDDFETVELGRRATAGEETANTAPQHARIPSRLGWRSSDGKLAYVERETFRVTFAASFAPSPTAAAKWFLEAGWLKRGDGKNITRSMRIEGQKLRVYVFQLDAVQNENGDEP